MRAEDLLRWCSEHDVHLAVDGDRVRWNAPQGTVNDRMKESFRRNKPELLALLSREPSRTLKSDALGSAPRIATHRPPDPSELPSASGDRPATSRARALGDACDAPEREASWITGHALEDLPESLQGLVCWREGWTPESWASYLQLRAAKCDLPHSEVAKRYETAAAMLMEG